MLNHYDSIGTLNQYIRNTLTSVIIKHEIQQSSKIEKNKFSLLSKGRYYSNSSLLCFRLSLL